MEANLASRPIRRSRGRVCKGKKLVSMSETYASLIEEWRKAAAATREAQARLKAQVDAHLDGCPEPSVARA